MATERPVLHPDLDQRSVGDLAGDQRPADPGLEGALEEALQRPGAVDRVVALAGDVLPRRVRELELHPAAGEPAAEVLEEEPDDLPDLVEAERLEEHHVVDPIQELRPEVTLVLEAEPVASLVRGHHQLSRAVVDIHVHLVLE